MTSPSSPQLSVIVPVYNVEPWLRRCLDSICKQTLRDIEIICVNDGSTDHSADILEEYAARDPRIRVIHQANGGLSAARNAGLDLCRAELITTVDSDDYIDPETYAELLPRMTEQTDLICFGVQVEANDLDWGNKMQRYFTLPDEQTLAATPQLVAKLNDTAWNKIYRRELIERFQLRYPHGIWYEDFSFTRMYSSICRNIRLTPKRYYHYVLRESSIMGQSLKHKTPKVIDRLTSMGVVLDFYERHGLTERFRPVISQWLHQLPIMMQRLPKDLIRDGKGKTVDFLRRHKLDQLFAEHDTVLRIMNPLWYHLRCLFYRDKETSTQFRFMGIPIFSLVKRSKRRRYRLLGLSFGPRVS